MFYQLDVRPSSLSATQEMLQKFLLSGVRVVGVEVSDSKLYKYLDANIDPQHSDGNSQMSAIKASLKASLGGVSNSVPTESSVAFVTIRPDLDSLGAMAILAGMVDLEQPSAIQRIEQIHRADCSRTDKWQPCNIKAIASPYP